MAGEEELNQQRHLQVQLEFNVALDTSLITNVTGQDGFKYNSTQNQEMSINVGGREELGQQVHTLLKFSASEIICGQRSHDAQANLRILMKYPYKYR